ESRREQRVEGMRMMGLRRYTQLVVPLSERVKEIPAVGFVYFDPRQERYVELREGPFKIEVAPAPEGSEVKIADYRPVGGGERKVKVLVEDILGIKRRAGEVGARRAIDDPVWIGGMVAGPLLWLGMVVVAKRRERLRTDKAFTRRLQAGGRLQRHLGEARGAYRRRAYRAVCEAVADGLSEYIADQLHVSAPQVNAESVRELLEKRGVRGETIEEVREVLGRCDYGRFGGIEVSGEVAREILERGERVARRLGRELR
ncbi:MAG: hypothetical protein N2595_06615, partial [bacterium]|nr:hypothetical protein [bacterium]